MASLGLLLLLQCTLLLLTAPQNSEMTRSLSRPPRSPHSHRYSLAPRYPLAVAPRISAAALVNKPLDMLRGSLSTAARVANYFIQVGGAQGAVPRVSRRLSDFTWTALSVVR